MTPIQQQLAALAKWHLDQASGMSVGRHAEAAALLDKLAKAENAEVYHAGTKGFYEAVLLKKIDKPTTEFQ
jgi:hypothetical protein